MAKPKRQDRLSLKLEAAQRKFIELTAKAQGHKNLSRVVKSWINREMQAH